MYEYIHSVHISLDALFRGLDLCKLKAVNDEHRATPFSLLAPSVPVPWFSNDAFPRGAYMSLGTRVRSVDEKEGRYTLFLKCGGSVEGDIWEVIA